MKCSKCGHENRAGAKFCEECAAALARLCTNCSTQLSPTAKFCSECAHPVERTSLTTPSSSARLVAPQAYTPKHLAEKIITSKDALEGERKQVTVLFADLKGSMELLAERDPEEARKLLDPIIEHMMQAVHLYEGTVNQVMGDGIMALFGAPLAHEDHAIRAAYAALRMQETVKHYAEGVQRTEGIFVRIRVGLNSGEVVVRSVGSDLRMDYTAVGQTTHLAARMEQIAAPGSIFISANTMNLVEGYVQAKPLGPLPIKGLESPIEVYEIVGAPTVRSRLHAAAARGLTPFVGRESELNQLQEALDHAALGRGQIVAVVGEPGVGKSRLYWEFTHSHRARGWLIIESGSVSYGKATSFLPIIDLLRSYFQIEAGDEARRIREKVTGKLLSLDRALEPSLPGLLWLLDVPVEDPQWQNIDAPQRRQYALDGIKRLLLRESQAQPLLVLFEDLHWIDAETQALLDSLVESLPTARLLLLVNYRPEYRHGWSGKTYYRQLRVDPLPPESADQLLDALLGKDAGLQPLKRLLIDRTEGNPFFLEESVRTLIETRALAGERGSFRLVKATETFQIPATAQAILAARIDRLSFEDKRLLQAASVIGKDVPFGLLEAIAGEEPQESLQIGLSHLQAAEFLYEARLFPDLEYTFKHALTHEVAYGSLLRDRRRVLHAKIVHAIETRYPDRINEQVERLAYHALRAELWEKAVTYLQQAGAKAFARSSNREALTYFEQALTALTHLPETRETREQGVDIRFGLRHALFPLAEFDETERYLKEAEILATTLGDQRRLGWVWGYMCTQAMWTGRPATEVDMFAQRVNAIGATLGDVPLQVAGQYYTAIACFLLGDYHGTERHCRTLMRLLDEGDRSRDRFSLAVFPAVLSRLFLARALAERGVFDEGEIQGREAIRIAEALDHPFSLIVACLFFAYVDDIRGETSQATRTLERTVALGRDRKITTFYPIALASLGHAYARSGRIKEGLSLLQQAMTAHESAGIGFLHAMSVIQFGEAYLAAGEVENAQTCADRAMLLARQRRERSHEAWAYRLQGEIASHPSCAETVTAEAHYAAALGLASELGMRPLEAHCKFGLGKLYHHVGKRREAQQELKTATMMYSEMNMQFWVQNAQAEMNQLANK